MKINWKIKTNMQKFTIIPISRYHPPPVTINNRDIQYSPRGKLLGLQLSSTGLKAHVTARAAQAQKTLDKMKRFSACSEKTKLRLYKTIVKPVLEYPPVPMHAISNNLMIKLQVVQNNALRWVSNVRWYDNRPVRDLHEEHNMIPINVRLHQRAKKIWESLEANEDPMFEQIQNAHEPDIRDHHWWPRSFHITTNQDEPEPYYTKNRVNQQVDIDIDTDSDYDSFSDED